MTVIEKFVIDNAISLEVSFVGLKNKDGWLAFEWQYILRDSTGLRTMTGTHSMGVGHIRALVGKGVYKNLSWGAGFELNTKGEIVFGYKQGTKSYISSDVKDMGKGLFVLPYGTTRLGWKTPLSIFHSKQGMDREAVILEATPPTAAGVLLSLVSDSSGVYPLTSFEDWADNYDYDKDSIKALKIYQACQEEADKLRKLLGTEKFEYLLNSPLEDEVE